MSAAASGCLTLRLPRSLLDARGAAWPAADDDGLLAVRLHWADGRIRRIEPLPAGERRAGAPLPLALTPLVEPHAHLDKAFTAAAFPNRQGTMQAALEANRREWAARTAEQVLGRGERALEQAWRQGVRAIRSHIDGLGPAGCSWEALRQLQQRWRGRVELQLVLLAPLEHWSTPEGEAQAQELAAAGTLLGGVLGPPYRFAAEGPRLLLELLRLAERAGAGVDLHVDESDRQPGRGVQLLARTVIEQRLALPITCSHASSLGLLGGHRLERAAELLAAAELTVVALPTTNLWLLGRRPEGTPRLRPLAPVAALQRAGVTVAVGGDNVQDPWFPGGDLDPLAVLGLSAVAFHLAPWERAGLAPFTTAAARLLALDWDGVLRPGAPADLVVLGVDDWYGVLARPPQRRVLRQGVWLEPPLAEAPSPLLACCR
ncbi:MAG: amidohydrolase family protein [Cyanobacteriota bacterium]|nr:amidohydrolase family protein [Cyanobacteriota bacterium]